MMGGSLASLITCAGVCSASDCGDCTTDWRSRRGVKRRRSHSNGTLLTNENAPLYLRLRRGKAAGRTGDATSVVGRSQIHPRSFLHNHQFCAAIFSASLVGVVGSDGFVGSV